MSKQKTVKLPIILDDLVEEELQNQIEDSMFDCFWTFSSDNTLGSKSSNMKYRKFLNPFIYDVAPFFCTNLKLPPNQKTYKKVTTLIEKGCNEINFNIEKVARCYGAIHALIGNEPKHDNIHLNRDIPHLVMLYYVNDSDGDTILYDKTLDDIPFKFAYPDDYYQLNIRHRISPKRGRILFFDGRVYHASSTPTKSNRCIITLDLFGEFADGSYKFPAPPEKNIKNNFKYQ